MTRTPPTPTTPSPRGFGNALELSPSSTLVDGLTPQKSHQPTLTPESKVEQVFEIHDLLVNDTSEFTNIVSLGGQSAGKTTVLSMITKIPLWSSGGRATVCPTQIHSRYRPDESFTARVEIQVTHPAADHIPRRLAFTTAPLKDVKKLADAMRMAGLMAKHFGDGDTYEEMMEWDKDELEQWLDDQSRSKNLPRFTDNVVILHVSGPTQSNVSIIDMPGLAGDPFVKNMIELEIAKTTNLILCCAPGSDKDISIEDTEFSLIQKHDPEAKRSIFVITKADQVDDPRGFVEYLDLSDPTWTLKPAHGWWFVSPKTGEENLKKTHDGLIRQRETMLFQDEKWNTLKQYSGFHHGTENLRSFLYTLFSSLVVKHIDQLEQLLHVEMADIETKLVKLPAEIDQPVEAVHNIVDTVSKSIFDALTEERQHTIQPFELQRDLYIQLGASLPSFFPFRKAEAIHDVAKSYKAPTVGGFTTSGAGTQIYMDEVHELVQKYTCPRDRLLAVHKVKPHFIVASASQWGATCVEHVREVWKVVMISIEMIVDEVCADHHALAARNKSILHDKAQEFIEATLSTVKIYCKREMDDPSLIDIPDHGSSDRTKVIEAYGNAYSQIYSVPLAPLASVKGANSEAEPSAEPTSTIATMPTSASTSTDAKWPPADLERRWCFYTMAASTVWLVEGVSRISMMVGRETQAQVRGFLKEISSTLRRELGLVQVSEEVEMEMKRIVEPDEKIVKERETLAKRKREFEAISTKFRKIHA